MLPIKSKLLLEVSVSCEGNEGGPTSSTLCFWSEPSIWVANGTPFERDERILQGVVILRRREVCEEDEEEEEGRTLSGDLRWLEGKFYGQFSFLFPEGSADEEQRNFSSAAHCFAFCKGKLDYVVESFSYLFLVFFWCHSTAFRPFSISERAVPTSLIIIECDQRTGKIVS